MRKSKFTEVQIVAILAQYEQGIKVTDICREHGISQATFYQWQRKYSGMGFRPEASEGDGAGTGPVQANRGRSDPSEQGAEGRD